jgi:hypothetical protein
MALEDVLGGLNSLNSVGNLAQIPKPEEVAQQAYKALTYVGEDLEEYKDLATNPEKLEQVLQELPPKIQAKVLDDTRGNMDDILDDFEENYGLDRLLKLGFEYSENGRKIEEYQQLQGEEQITEYFLDKDKEGKVIDNIFNKYVLRSTPQQLQEMVGFYSEVEQERYQKDVIFENDEGKPDLDSEKVFTYIKDGVEAKGDDGYLEFAETIGKVETQKRQQYQAAQRRQYEAQQNQQPA